MLDLWICYMNSLNFRFSRSWREKFWSLGGRRKRFEFASFLFDSIHFLVSFESIHDFWLYYGLWMWNHFHERLKSHLRVWSIKLRVRNLEIKIKMRLLNGLGFKSRILNSLHVSWTKEWYNRALLDTSNSWHPLSLVIPVFLIIFSSKPKL